MNSNYTMTSSVSFDEDSIEKQVTDECLLTESPILSGSDLTVILNHEVRTSINVIMGFAQILRLGGVNRDELKSYTDTICSESEHLLYLFTELIDLPILNGLLLPPDYLKGIQTEV